MEADMTNSKFMQADILQKECLITLKATALVVPELPNVNTPGNARP
jgi:hypothetical protein